jgi:signal peptidase I
LQETQDESGFGPQVLDLSDTGRRSMVATVWDWTRSIAVAFLLFVVVRTFLVEAFKIPTSSMENTLLVGDFLLVNKAAYGAEIPGTHLHLPGFEEPRRGDVIVFVPPIDPTKNYVKRVVGVPGDTLQMRDKHLFVNGFPLNEPYVRYIDRNGDAVHPDMRWQSNHLLAGPARSYHPTRDNWGPLVVPDDDYFVLGDNRDNSEDSRYWGFVSRDAIRGKPWLVYYSFDPTGPGPMPWLRDVRWGRLGERIH